MAVINKHVEKAERSLQKGKLAAALEEYLLAWKEEPANDAIVQTVADLYLRLNKLPESLQCYTYLFDKYAEKGEAPRAIEFFRKMQRFGPVDPRRLIRCAQLLEKVRPEEAVEHYRYALDSVVGQDPALALQCLDGLAQLQPSSLEVQARIAAVALKLGKTTLAVSAYHKVGALRMAEGRHAEAIEALEEACRLPGAPPEVRLDLARACAKAGRFARVLDVLAPTAAQSNDAETLKMMAEAHRAEHQLEKAEEIYWKLLERTPDAINPLLEIAVEYLHRDGVSKALQTLQAIEQHLTGSRQQQALTVFAEKLSQIEHTHISVLEFLASLLDRLHLDTPLSKSLNRLFDLHFAAGEFSKAVDVLQRLIDIDLYAPECSAKLERLEGKVEPALWRELASRLGKGSTSEDVFDALREEATAGAETGKEPEDPAEAGNTLRDLILQAEIFLQYKLEDKAKERLQRISKLFPHEEERNENLKELFEKSRFKPQYAEAAPAPVVAAEPQDIRSHLSRVSEISRNLSRQGTVKGVLSTAVNDVGRHWQASRCVVGLLIPNRPPSMVLEYISPGILPSDPVLLGKLLMGLQQITLAHGSLLVAESVAKSSHLAALQNFLTTQKVESLVAVLLRDGEQPSGLLVLEECGSTRAWKSNELAGLEALAEQIVLAVANVRLRNLMRTLAVTDERSGLLHRESYIPCLLSETERMLTQKKPLSAGVLHFGHGNDQPLDKRQQQSLEEFIQDFSGTFVSHLRQSDIAVRYGPHALALILPGATGKDAVLILEKFRKLAASGPLTPSQRPSQMAVGVAEAVQEAKMESVDVVTELINRLEKALEAARLAGGNATRVLEPPALSQ